MTLAVQFAMALEAAPFLERGTFGPPTHDATYGFHFHEGKTKQGVSLVVAVAGAHPRFGVDSIGTIPASLLTHSLLERFKPSRLINAGTAGGFESRGGKVGDVYLGADVAVFHDRRIPLPGFEAMGRGHFPVECDRALAARLGLKVGIVSTGDSLDCTPEDLKHLTELQASVKEMEAAGIAWVCERHRVPLVLLKAITDIVDHPASTQSQFLENYGLAVARLAESLEALVAHHAGVQP
jgi:5'-methylthioadenosine/S-adenosylhomocysteine nucleosidase